MTTTPMDRASAWDALDGVALPRSFPVADAFR